MKIDNTIRSEDIEPTMAYLTGRWFNKCEAARKRKDEIVKMTKEEGRELSFEEYLECDRFWKECNNMWHGMKGLTRVAICCEEAVHFCLAHQNNKHFIGNYIEKYLGIDPWKKWADKR